MPYIVARRFWFRLRSGTRTTCPRLSHVNVIIYYCYYYKSSHFNSGLIIIVKRKTGLKWLHVVHRHIKEISRRNATYDYMRIRAYTVAPLKWNIYPTCALVDDVVKCQHNLYIFAYIQQFWLNEPSHVFELCMSISATKSPCFAL